jgi:hypothetical protein
MAAEAHLQGMRAFALSLGVTEPTALRGETELCS